ncbi:hypothetical protein LJB90_01855 [Eubacteriales bacterium OttesenSCG-928-G02]|nr:hypothetical protein [Eubacteriales bacterium OttesenSCG-928-G02]
MTYTMWLIAVNRALKSPLCICGQSTSDFPLVDFKKLYRMNKSPAEAAKIAISVYSFIKEKAPVSAGKNDTRATMPKA